MAPFCACLQLREDGKGIGETLGSRLSNATLGWETFSQTFVLEGKEGERLSADLLPLAIVFENDSSRYHFEVDPVYGMNYRSGDYPSSTTSRFFGIAYEYAGARIVNDSSEEFEGWDIQIATTERENETSVDVGYRIPVQASYVARQKVQDLLQKNLTGAQLASRVETNCHASDFEAFDVELEVGEREVSLEETTRLCNGEMKRSEEAFGLLKDERPLENLSLPLLAFDYSTTRYVLNRQLFEDTRRQDDFGIGNRVSEKLVGTGGGGRIEVSYASYFDVILGEVTIGGEQYLFSLNANLNPPPEGQAFLSAMFPSRGKSMPKISGAEDALRKPPRLLEMEIDKTTS